MSQYYAKWPDGFEVTWRNLSWAEYRSFRRQFEHSPFEEPMSVALDIYRTVYTDGPDPKFVPAGIPAFICKQQMVDNPFGGKYEDIAQALELARRVVTGDYLMSTKGLIASTLNYKPEEIDKWDPNTFFIRLAQAEIALGRTFDPLDPKATKDASAKKPAKHLTLSQQKAVNRTKERDRG